MTGQEYIEDHTINTQSIEKFRLKVLEDRVIIPVKDETGKLEAEKVRLMEGKPKFKNPHDFKMGLFNAEILKKKLGYVIITGGELDCIRLDQEELNAVTSSAGEGTFKQEWVEQLKEVPNVFLCLDNDEAGKNATQKLSKHFPHARIIQFPEGAKDVCEFFKFHTLNDFIKIMKKAKIVEPDIPEVDEEEDFKTLSAEQLLEMEFEDQQWLIERFITTGGITLIVGESGTGKSYVSLAILKSLINNESLFDKFPALASPNILVIDKENGLRRTKKRMQAMGVPFSEKLFFLKFPEKFSLDNQKGLEVIADFIKTNQIGLIIVDSLIDVVIGSENSSVDISQVFNSLRSIAPESSYLIIHHDSKPIPRFQRTAGQKTRGSSNIIAQVDNQFYLEKQKNNQLHIEQGKSRDFEPVKKFCVQFESNQEGEMVGFKWIGEVESEINKVDEAANFVENFLFTSTDQSRQQIIDAAEAAGHSTSSIKRAMQMMKERKILGDKPSPDKKSKKLFFITSPKESGDSEDEEELEVQSGLDFVED